MVGGMSRCNSEASIGTYGAQEHAPRARHRSARGNETGEQRADQCSYPKARPEQAVSLDSSMQDLVAIERQGCFQRTIREKEEH